MENLEEQIKIADENHRQATIQLSELLGVNHVIDRGDIIALKCKSRKGEKLLVLDVNHSHWYMSAECLNEYGEIEYVSLFSIDWDKSCIVGSSDSYSASWKRLKERKAEFLKNKKAKTVKIERRGETLFVQN